MKSENVFKNDEKIIFALRSLYNRFGYNQYKMNKFEEYELYVRNKDYLISDSVITFTDTNGKLLALKPDVTLSIIKNTKDIPELVQRVYYNENVYRISDRTHNFKEIMQVGLECIGDIDNYNIYEVLKLALESLRSISPNFVLDISHLSILSAVIDYMNISDDIKSEILKFISQKNIHEMSILCQNNGVSQDKINLLREVICLYGQPDIVLPKLKNLLNNVIDTSALTQLEDILSVFSNNDIKNINIDFSVVSDMKYYNGIVFTGFIKGIPDSVLLGGQYDTLMQKMNRKSRAIGFAVYIDNLNRLDNSNSEYDVDTLILYDCDTSLSCLQKTINFMIEEGKTVTVQKSIPTKLKYRNLIKIEKGVVSILENNA